MAACSDENEACEIPTVLIIGVAGAGKSSLGNALSGKKIDGESSSFVVGSGGNSVTQKTSAQVGNFCGLDDRKLCLIDTPGHGDRSGRDADFRKNMIQELKSHRTVHAILWVVNAEKPRMDGQDFEFFRLLTDVFGPGCLNNLVINFSYYGHGEHSVRQRERQAKTLESLTRNVVEFIKEFQISDSSEPRPIPQMRPEANNFDGTTGFEKHVSAIEHFVHQRERQAKTQESLTRNVAEFIPEFRIKDSSEPRPIPQMKPEVNNFDGTTGFEKRFFAIVLWLSVLSLSVLWLSFAEVNNFDGSSVEVVPSKWFRHGTTVLETCFFAIVLSLFLLWLFQAKTQDSLTRNVVEFIMDFQIDDRSDLRPIPQMRPEVNNFDGTTGFEKRFFAIDALHDQQDEKQVNIFNSECEELWQVIKGLSAYPVSDLEFVESQKDLLKKKLEEEEEKRFMAEEEIKVVLSNFEM